MKPKPDARIARVLPIAAMALFFTFPLEPASAQRRPAPKRPPTTVAKRPDTCAGGCWEVAIDGKVFRGDKAFFQPGQAENVVLTHEGFSSSGIVYGGVGRGAPLVSAGEYETYKGECSNGVNHDKPDPDFEQKFLVSLEHTPQGSLISINGTVVIEVLTKTRIVGRFDFSGYGVDDSPKCFTVPVKGTFTAVVSAMPSGGPGT